MNTTRQLLDPVTAKGDFLGQSDLFNTQYPLVIKIEVLNCYGTAAEEIGTPYNGLLQDDCA